MVLQKPKCGGIFLLRLNPLTLIKRTNASMVFTFWVWQCNFTDLKYKT